MGYPLFLSSGQNFQVWRRACHRDLQLARLNNIRNGKPSALGFATGAIAGLAAITLASGNVGALGAMVIGFSAGVICYWASTTLKRMLGYDDALDVVGVHGFGGVVGTLLVSVFAAEFL